MYLESSMGGRDPYLGAWFGNADLKAEVMERLHKHREDDEIIQGVYQRNNFWDARTTSWLYEKNYKGNYKGCAIGCTLPLQSKDPNELSGIMDWHERIEREYNIPAPVAEQIDELFEGQHTFKDAADFAVASIETIAVGADLRELAAQVRAHVFAAEAMDEMWDEHKTGDCWVCRGVAGEFLHLLERAPIAVGARALILIA